MNRFIENVLLGKVGQLLFYKMLVFLIGAHVDIFLGQYLGETVVGLLQLGTPHAEEVYKLFGFLFAAAGPQAATFSAGEDDAVIVLMMIHSLNEV